MQLLRSQLKNIYSNLPNYQKTEWALNANYSSYQGLYRYLSNNGHEVAYKRVVDALKKTVGEQRFQELIKEQTVQTNKRNLDIENLIDRIFSREDMDSQKYDIFESIANRLGFDIDSFFEKETEMTDMLRKFPNSEELIKKIRMTTQDIINMVIVHNFAIPLAQENSKIK
ncbi:hypothetical protein [Defluviitalea phaphyphila]|uniref:hypothetical protein n=1 Tax=Defluviitalea phaphyphila TaxID=1473580 RepID=UPI00072FC55B|nr:hypothetical protein [Defluviitalea phaphyphila]